MVVQNEYFEYDALLEKERNPMIKAVFFDVDGTLLSHELGMVPESTKKALMQLRRQGIKIFMATGRHTTEFFDLPLEGLEFDGYIILNGQICLDQDGEVLDQRAIHSEDVKKLLWEFEKKEVPVMIIEKDRMYINKVNDRVRTAQQEISTSIPNIGKYQGDVISQFVIYLGEDEAKELLKSLSHCKMSRWNSYGFDIIPKEGGKVSGIEKILEHYGFGREEIMAFGDGENDMEMLKYAGIGVAMGNAEDEVKQCADYVTIGVSEDGVQKALCHFHLLESCEEYIL